jgi:hypothetical protein
MVIRDAICELHACIAAPAPTACPIAKLLDHVLGTNEVHTYKKAERKSFLQFHRIGEESLVSTHIVTCLPFFWGGAEAIDFFFIRWCESWGRGVRVRW